MTVIVLSNCPTGLRGFLTRWLLEISPGVFVGRPSARVREALWAEVREYAREGRALLTYSTDTEQGYTFETHDHHWQPLDHEGITLIRRPSEQPTSPTAGTTRPSRQGWSTTAKRRRYGR
ncbi:type I-E CRISPR-associated endoribonuclease Cas2e [Streptomyces sp. NPDC006925]|uniref:type I-E CRISPR-associated endoribonuclease Cas2e n=1 Tax=Streptomyces sp. NPDC006925 TaxID=3364768 RepID=UPI00369615E3